ncbi:hypothetical protein D3C85_1178000 [compost metagenome]
MDDLPTETLDALEGRSETLVVAIVAAGGEQPAAGEEAALAAGVILHQHLPAGALAAPVCRDHALAVADMPLDAMLGDGLAQVAHDGASVGDGLLVLPGLELVAEGVEVGVGADAGITEQVPGATQVVAGFQYLEAPGRLLALQVAGGADTGQAGADDQHIENIPRGGQLGGHGRFLALVVGATLEARAGLWFQQATRRTGRKHGKATPPANLRTLALLNRAFNRWFGTHPLDWQKDHGPKRKPRLLRCRHPGIQR